MCRHHESHDDIQAIYEDCIHNSTYGKARDCCRCLKSVHSQSSPSHHKSNGHRSLPTLDDQEQPCSVPSALPSDFATITNLHNTLLKRTISQHHPVVNVFPYRLSRLRNENLTSARATVVLTRLINYSTSTPSRYKCTRSQHNCVCMHSRDETSQLMIGHRRWCRVLTARYSSAYESLSDTSIHSMHAVAIYSQLHKHYYTTNLLLLSGRSTCIV